MEGNRRAECYKERSMSIREITTVVQAALDDIRIRDENIVLISCF